MVDEVEVNLLTIWNLFFKACLSCLYSLELPKWESFIYETWKWQIEFWKVILTIKAKWLNAHGSRWEWSFLKASWIMIIIIPNSQNIHLFTKFYLVTVWLMLKHAFCHVCVLSSWDPRARWTGGNISSKCEWNFNTLFHLTFPNACYCSWPVSKIHLSLVRTVSLKMMHTVLNPNSWNQFSLHISLLAHPVHGFGSVQTVRSTPEFSLARPVHRAPGLEYRSNGAQ